MKSYKIIMMGPPGSGKGTQAKMMAERYDLEHISTGDIFRVKREDGSDLGNKIKELIDNGHFVPDDVTIEIVKEKLESMTSGYILDGFPRTLPQAEALEEFADIEHIIYMNVAEDELVERLASRLMCKCGESYNKISRKPKIENICDTCDGDLYQRDDETPEIVSERLKVYDEKTKPLLDFYKDKIFQVEGKKGIVGVFKDIKKFLD